ncbi:DUF4124 domain-containing protein [Methylotenera sp.]|uniref:DUF4124 domain-containing protein n=1 Tax=Methylotenera sp. TaxID=2051956 RepID=UPI00272FCF37|nr:DUF4124 domain-containing protein [Methylotenera sp.]MDP2229938.1 DUF4124 domain-containing protein [Methylotenera sp.]
MIRLILMTLLTLLCTQYSYAEVYKCKDSHNKTIYSDKPCSIGLGSKLDINTNSPQNSQPVEKSPVIRQLDASVAGAIAQGDLSRAESLAVTKEQWESIATAKRINQENQNKIDVGRTEADLSAEKGNSFDCQQAKRSYELDASDRYANESKIKARQSMMRQACGMKEPIEINNKTEVNVNNSRKLIINKY